MSPPRPRYSIKTYAGKKKPKASLLINPSANDDLFEKLCSEFQSKANIFDSSSERENSNSSSAQNTFAVKEKRGYGSPIPTFLNQKKGCGSVVKRDIKNCYNGKFKSFEKNKMLQNCTSTNLYKLECSTPKLQIVSRRFKLSKTSSSLSDMSLSPSALRVHTSLNSSNVSPIVKNEFSDSQGLNGSPTLKEDSISSATTPRTAKLEPVSENTFCDVLKEESSQSSSAGSPSEVGSRDKESLSDSLGINETLSKDASGNLPSAPTTLSCSQVQNGTFLNKSDSSLQSTQSESHSNSPFLEFSPVKVMPEFERLSTRVNSRKSERLLLKGIRESMNFSKSPISSQNANLSTNESDVWQLAYLKLVQDNYNDNVLPGDMIRISVQENIDEESSHESPDQRQSERVTSTGESKSDQGVTVRRRRNLNHCRRPHVLEEPGYDTSPDVGDSGSSTSGSGRLDWPTTPNSHSRLSVGDNVSSPGGGGRLDWPSTSSRSRSSGGSDVERRRMYHRMTQSLPACFKDGGSAFGRNCISDVDLRRSRPGRLGKTGEEPSSTPLLYSSTRSLPAVLEDQDLESSTDEEMQSCSRTIFPFRKSSLEQSSLVFYGFPAFELGRRRAFVMKKHSEESASTSPHTLPVLPENDSDSSCESGDESKRVESGSSSQIESPVMSPGVQGSPSRQRDTSSLSSSRSDGLVSPLQEDLATPPRSSSPEAASEDDSPSRRDDQSRRRRPSRLASRITLGYIAEESELDASDLARNSDASQAPFFFIPGKRYRRSIMLLQSRFAADNVSSCKSLETLDPTRVMQKEDSSLMDSDDSWDLSPDSRKSQSLNRGQSQYDMSIDAEDSRSSPDMRSPGFRMVIPRRTNRYSCAVYCVDSNQVDVSEAVSRLTLGLTDISTLDVSEVENYTAEDAILALCNIKSPLEFHKIFDDGSLSTWKKVGEGVYSEVFSLQREDSIQSVLKIIPVEGDIRVNGCDQMTLSDNISEVLITKFLSELRDSEENTCEGFVKLIRLWYVEGCYPPELLKLWNEFNEEFTSDNDNPTIFPEHQKYLCLELANSGRALESYIFSSARQSLSVFKQIVFSLAIAENTFEFEHRDLHWGNILVNKTKERNIHYLLNGKQYRVLANGVKATIIDYTWSSLTSSKESNLRVISDMEQDPDLFLGRGDLQFDVYRQMREDVERDWSRYRPKTNVRWLYYLADKLINTSQYSRPSTAAHKEGITSFQRILNLIPSCDSSLQLAVEHL